MVQGMDDMVGGGKAIKAEVPLSEMFGYSTTCVRCPRAATYTMEFKHYAEAPRNVARPSWRARAKNDFRGCDGVPAHGFCAMRVPAVPVRGDPATPCRR